MPFPNLASTISSIGNESLGFPTTQTLPTIDSGVSPDTGDSFWSKYMGAFNKTQDAAVDNPAVTLSNLSGLNPNDVATGKSSLLTGNLAAFVIGVIAIGAGLLMFKTTGTVIVGAGKLAAKGAALAA
jgi:hypothetical protein